LVSVHNLIIIINHNYHNNHTNITVNNYYYYRKPEEIIDVQKKQTFYNPKDISQTSTSSSSITSHPPIASNMKDKILLQKPTPKLYNRPESPLSTMKVHKNSSFSKGNIT